MKIYHNEQGYYDLLEDLLDYGLPVSDRTGVGTIAIFDAKLVVSRGRPFLSTLRSAPLRMAFEEFWMFLRGETQTKALEDKGVFFWKGNTTREFLDNRNLSHLEEGDMGKAYGYQFRNFNENIDQLKESLRILKEDPYSRRNIVTFWNPSQSDEMALTPCWHTHQLVVLPDSKRSNVLHMKLINRSLDTLFGLLFAVQQYRLYQQVLAEMYGFELGTLSCDLSQVHLYNNQIEYAKECLTRQISNETPKITIKKVPTSLEELVNMEFSNIEVENLLVNVTPFNTPKPPMSA